MRTNMKGTFKAGFKYISSIFVVKEPEIEIQIGYPTDVKHLAHIGWDGQTGSAPSWMKEFKQGPDFAATNIGKSDLGESTRKQSGSEFHSNTPVEIPKKHKRKKNKSDLSGTSSSSSLGSFQTGKSKAKLAQGNPDSADVEVALC
ncbi:PREDICTED: CRIB domain-containing protein RIC10-like isoform X2 [Ipomoea nil]|uniref:CRIB domain-containing protein RIC10-like isoform X2 n=1 Tax=Ipomoea nil TaxID=35883 RepID=UPI0009012E56|nr:PREDICTED: CRIB domain-containing protein RIC10-like isoform X2 [Ipomoea nil]